jgi:hypothetical protein
VCVRERGRQRESVCVRERETERDRGRDICVCVYVCVCVCVYVFERESLRDGEIFSRSLFQTGETKSCDVVKRKATDKLSYSR